MELPADSPILLPYTSDQLRHPLTGEQHPLGRKLRLIACHLSGKQFKHMEFLRRLQTPEEKGQNAAVEHTSRDGLVFGTKGIEVPFVPMQ